MNDLIVLLIFLPFAGGLLCLAARFLPRIPLAQAAAVSTPLASMVVLAALLPELRELGELRYALGGWPEPLGIALHLDMLAWTASAMGTLISFCALLFALGEGSYGPDFYFSFLMLTAGMEGVVLAADIFNMFVFIEILSIASYILIAHSGKGGSLLASFRYLLLSSLSIAFFLLGIFLLYRSFGTLSLRLISRSLAEAGEPRPDLLIAASCLTVGVGLKAAFLPLHTWLPDAHAAAPHPVSAVLSGVMIKISFLAVWRILEALGAESLRQMFLWIGPLTAVFGVFMALAQIDAKRLLAYHSVSQMGLIAAAYGAGTAAGLAASLAHILSHSAFKSLLFLSTGSAIRRTGRRCLTEKPQCAPGVLPGLFFLIGALAISGMPPTNGFVSKTLVSSVLKEMPVLSLLLKLTAVGTAASMIKLSAFFRRIPAGPAKSSAGCAAPEAPESRTPVPCLLSLGILAMLCMAGGLLPAAMVGNLILPAVGAIRSPVAYNLPHLLEATATAGLGLGVYLLINSHLGARLAGAVRRRRLSMEAALLLVAAALLAFILAGLTA